MFQGLEIVSGAEPSLTLGGQDTGPGEFGIGSMTQRRTVQELRNENPPPHQCIILMTGVTLPQWVFFCVLPSPPSTLAHPQLLWHTSFPSAAGNRCSHHEKKQLMASNIVSGKQGGHQCGLSCMSIEMERMRIWLQTDCAALRWISMYCSCTVQVVVWAPVSLLPSPYGHSTHTHVRTHTHTQQVPAGKLLCLSAAEGQFCGIGLALVGKPRL